MCEYTDEDYLKIQTRENGSPASYFNQLGEKDFSGGGSENMW